MNYTIVNRVLLTKLINSLMIDERFEDSNKKRFSAGESRHVRHRRTRHAINFIRSLWKYPLRFSG
jgi:hypothetical protein